MDAIMYLVDNRNRALWEELSTRYNISVLPSENDEYSAHSINNDIVIQYVPTNLCIDSFTHEMLHVYLRAHDCYIGAGLKLTIRGSRMLSRSMSFRLLEHIGNCLDHIKMLPIYLEMGFAREKFIKDYHVHKCDAKELTAITKHYRVGKKLVPLVIDAFLGRLFSMLADPNNTFNYAKELEKLRQIDPLLFQINVKMMEHWKQINIDGTLLDDSYHNVVFSYYEDLKGWLSKNQFVI